ncbi:phospholipase D family protein [Rhodococcus sp. CX]|uniref:phospholipase D family protein n=1 Tax=Rhodococcus sp. CX TaxID=2789880 RepID=UPI0018CEB9E6|nr:phospholipase D family protein [Rhodococcus sp. CX]MBH0120029.1 phospholipase D family protein [Rhodococcus sp. CX]
MSVVFVTGSVWDEITAAVRSRGRRYAAVAFLGADAPALLPLTRGDMLVVNASDSAVRSRSTSPEAIAAYLEAGVRVYSEGELHAKVIATSTTAVIGSANASAHSRDRTIEAAVVTGSMRMIDKVRTFVEGLAEETKRLTAADLPRLRKLWDEGEANDPRRAVPGVNRDPEGLIVDVTAGFVLDRWDEMTVDPDVEKQVNRAVRRGCRDASLGVDWLLLEPGDTEYDEGAVVFVYDEDGVEPPIVITGPPAALPRSRRRRYQPYRFTRADAGNWKEWDEVEGCVEALRATLDDHDGRLEGRLDDPDGVGRALLGLWGIEVPDTRA